MRPPSDAFAVSVQVVMNDTNGWNSVLLSKYAVWKDSLAVPFYVAVLSAFVLLLHLVLLSKPVRRLNARLFRSNAPLDDLTSNVHVPQSSAAGFITEAKEHVVEHGGAVIYAYMFARLVGCLSLLALSLATLIFTVREKSDIGYFTMGKHWGKKHHKHNHRHSPFSPDELLQVLSVVTFAYISFLALVSVCARRRLSRLVTRHLAALLLVTFVVYVYRDIWPLTTFTLSPRDLSEGWFLWAKVTVLSIAAAVIPLLTPRQYVPFDPKEPAVANPEQTTPLLSLVLFSFMDPLVFLAYRVPHLSNDQLYPLADYDFARNLKKTCFFHLDPFSGKKGRRHLFFGLMRVYGREYTTLALMLVINVIASFMSPLGINRLLNYLESEGEAAIVRPWVWIVWLFAGPFIGSLGMNWYIFIATRTLVRTEGILTQLIFEHALRIRMKTETESSAHSDQSSLAPTPDSISIAEDEQDHTPTGSSNSGEETLHASSLSVKSGTSGGSKGKRTKKSLEATTPLAKAGNLVGKINNLVSTDLNNITEARDFMFVLIYIPLQIFLCIWFLYAVLGWAAIVGLATILLLFPLPGFVASVIQRIQVERLKRTDARVQMVTEVMNVLRMIKLFGWERNMKEKVAEKREEELKYVWRRQLMDLINGSINFLIPVITMVTTFVTYTVVMKEELSASKVYSSMAVFDMLRDQLHMVMYFATAAVQGKVSLDRVNDFLLNTELLDSFACQPNDVVARPFTEDSRTDKDTIGLRDATFSWSNETDGSLTPSRRGFTLKIEGELLFKEGSINLIIGPTGSGKTSLLMALLGEMHYIPSGPDSWFNLPRERGVAYAAQESWVQNETIRENIVFGAPFDEARYKKVIYQCGLERDLSLFDAGDKTEVGEKGLTLSGGQKARITLARAVYSPARLLLLDDVLAALDVHTAKWIIDKCFKGDLIKGRTVLLVTHNVAATTSIADFVVSLGLDGGVVSQGSISDALDKNKSLAFGTTKVIDVKETASEEVYSTEPTAKQSDGKLVVAEEVAEGHVSWAAINLFLSGVSGDHPFLFWFAFMSGMFLVEISNSIQTWWLGHWAAQYALHPGWQVSVSYYLGVYGSLLGFAAAIYCISMAMYMFGSVRASRTIHNQLVESVLGTTLRWLDTTPTSRVIARCTQDIRAVDGPISSGVGWLAELTSSMLIKFCAVVTLTPIFLIPGVIVAALGGWCGQIYMKAQLSVKREMSNARSPVLGHFGAAIAGLTSIRAYGAEAAFVTESLDRIDKYTRAARTFYNLNRWVGMRIDALGGLFAAGLAAYLVYAPGFPTAANTGFSLNQAVGFSSLILWWVRVLNDTEINANSLERIQAYVTIEQEPKPSETGYPPAYWPASGDIRVENMSARYSPDGPKVLHDISFHIKSGERVGVVGRTGSGKSSLTLSLLRCIYTDGAIYYDGISTASLNLDSIRSNITIIPQVPELLSGSLRQNLDPFDQYEDVVLNDALRAAGLFSLQSETDEGRITLDTTISGGGSNLSVGQRQILALARAIVRGSKLLILDEATSAIDYKTDSVIQSSLRNDLGGDVTLITVAHRLQTIMDSDKIMVLDAGRIVEYDSPSKLLKNEKGLLRSLVEQSEDKVTLYAMASGRSESQ